MTAPEGWTLTRGIWRWTAAVSPEEYDHLNGRGDTTLDLDQLACACGASVTEICRTANGNPAGPHRYRKIPRRCTCGAAPAQAPLPRLPDEGGTAQIPAARRSAAGGGGMSSRTMAATCRACGDRLIPKHAWNALAADARQAHRRAGRAKTGGRGLCSRCHERIGKHGQRADYERLTMPGALVVEEYEHADHLPGESRKARIRRLAPRLGMTPEAMERALLRAQKRQESAA